MEQILTIAKTSCFEQNTYANILYRMKKIDMSYSLRSNKHLRK